MPGILLRLLSPGPLRPPLLRIGSPHGQPQLSGWLSGAAAMAARLSAGCPRAVALAAGLLKLVRQVLTFVLFCASVPVRNRVTCPY